jgi:uncharacterized OB-fold protein
MTTTHGSAPVAPEPDADSRAFWRALSDHRLEVPSCTDCGRLFFPPRPGCPRCGSTAIQPVLVSGNARVYSWVTVHVALDSAFATDVPYTIVTAELEEAPEARILGRLRSAGDLIAAGMRLRFAPYEVGDGIVLPGFVVADHARGERE